MRKTNRQITENSLLITPAMASERYNLNRGSVVQLAKQGGAFLKIGKNARIDIRKMDDYIHEQYTV